jgi:hypothetical protein
LLRRLFFVSGFVADGLAVIGRTPSPASRLLQGAVIYGIPDFCRSRLAGDRPSNSAQTKTANPKVSR